MHQLNEDLGATRMRRLRHGFPAPDLFPIIERIL
jgi:hypothetical protein